MPAYGTCVLMLVLCNSVLWYPQWRWTREFPTKWFFSRTPQSMEFSLAWLGYIGCASISAALSIILSRTYATDMYKNIIGTHCGSSTVNTLGSLSAMFAEKPNNYVWTMGVMGAVPVMTTAVTVLYFRSPKPQSVWRLPGYLAALLEVSMLTLLTVRLCVCVLSLIHI